MTDTPLEYCRSCDHTHVLGTACWFASDATVDPPAPPDPLRWQPIESLDLPDTGFPDFAIVAWRGSDGMWDVGEAFHDGAWFSCFGNTRIEPVYGMPLPPAPSEAAIEAVRAPEDEDLDTTTTVTVGELKHWFCSYALAHPDQAAVSDAVAGFLDEQIAQREMIQR